MAIKALKPGWLSRALSMSSIAVVLVLAAVWHAPQADAQDASAEFDPSVRPEYREPVTLASKDGVLEVTLTAHQGHASLDTVAKPVENMLVFGYRLNRGTASDGQASGISTATPPAIASCDDKWQIDPSLGWFHCVPFDLL